jgi:hypothetical protein
MKALRVFFVSISGAFGGALLAAAFLAISAPSRNSYDQTLLYFGPTNGWKLVVIVGAVYGLVAGLGLGMVKVLRLLVLSISGALGGALLGAALLGISGFVMNYGDQTLTYFGPAKEMWKFWGMVGALYGWVPGFGLGLVVGVAECGKGGGSLGGATVGLILTALFLQSLLNVPPDIRETVRVGDLLVSVAPIPLGALFGLVLASIAVSLRVRQIARSANRPQLQ